ncbi:hypothetical protein QJQ45_016199 [Haematococcus lacustris]|nr:hypothetical protein QJQ45_016199 [Haematococcus lacustris]
MCTSHVKSHAAPLRHTFCHQAHSARMPELRHVAGAVLRSITGTQILSDKLWATQPALVLVLRRPGCGAFAVATPFSKVPAPCSLCGPQRHRMTQPSLPLYMVAVLCRDEAKRLWQLHEKAEALGISMNCVVHEWREREIEAFAPAYWPGPLYHDVDKAFYKALGGGQVVKGSSLSLLNPFSSTWARIRKAQQQVSEHNLVGEGLIMGGLMVIGKGEAGVLYSHLETDLGVHADHAEVLQAMQAAAKTAGTGPA